jgi:hypothetical protein
MTEALLARAVRTLPVIHQQHWIKAALALDRLRAFFKDRSEAQFQTWIERTDWSSQPTVSGPLYASVSDPARRPTGRWMRQLERGMVASAAPSAMAAIQEQGVEKFIAGFSDEVAESPGYLGHALSVLMIFLRMIL